MIKHFTLFKVKEKKNDKEPDYRISAKVDGEFVEVGAGWVKDGANGKYVSCSLAKPYKDRVGYIIVKEPAYKPENGEVSPTDLPDEL